MRQVTREHENDVVLAQVARGRVDRDAELGLAAHADHDRLQVAERGRGRLRKQQDKNTQR